MELWARIGKTNKKFQGSFKKVVEDLLKEAKGKKTVQLLSFHAGQKERRRFKRELRANDKDLVKTATAIVRWYYTIELRRLRRRIKELKKKARYTSKGEIFYCPKIMEEVKALQEKEQDLLKKLEALN